MIKNYKTGIKIYHEPQKLQCEYKLTNKLRNGILDSFMVQVNLQYNLLQYYQINNILKTTMTTKIFLLIMIVIVCSQSYPCPKKCKCELGGTSSCQVCLFKSYNRRYENSSSCPCSEEFIENVPPQEFCCPNDCLQCFNWGCYSCKTNWTKRWSNTDLNYYCYCNTNFYYNQTYSDCLCAAETEPTLYYQPSRFICLACPKQCKCDFTGCYFCKPQTNRIIELSKINQKTCFCNSNFTQINETCSLTSGTPPSNQCPLNQIKRDNTCVCQDPYYFDINNNCVCKSLLQPALYYYFKGVCYTCPIGCICNEAGCVSCIPTTNRIIVENNCTCSSFTIELYNLCICLSPYDAFNCNCNSIQFPNQFYKNNQKICHFCPKDCNCNASGCVSCNAITTNRNNSCYCNPPFVQIDGLCTNCVQQFQYINFKCICPSQINGELAALYYIDQEKNFCNKCPIGCTCSKIGCSSCDSYLKRKIATNNRNIATCYCDASLHFRDTKFFTCECIPPYTYDGTTNSCSCNQPYQINSTTQQCQCKSISQSNKYYLYAQNDCRLCPLSCNCSSSGCYHCTTNTGRIILISSLSLKICPCIPISTSQSTGYCTSCAVNQYVWKNKCITCKSSCQTCNKDGCTSCFTGFNLINNTCMCTQDDKSNNIFNQNNTCVCLIGFYYLNSKICQACPLNCRDCKFHNLTENSIVCIQCHQNVYRIDNPESQCPCIPYYNESENLYSFCCHWSCKDCDINGCTSCLPDTNRYLNKTNLNNITCSCLPDFINIYKMICECPPHTYFYNNECFICPEYCFECTLVSLIMNCTACDTDYNRTLTQIMINGTKYVDCACISRFTFLVGENYCHPEFCINYTNNFCHTCIQSRTPTADGMYCNCSIGFYENSDVICQKCNEGCLQCLLAYVCIKCDISNQYYLVFDLVQQINICVIPKTTLHFITQNPQGLNLETSIPQLTDKPILNVSVYLINPSDLSEKGTVLLQHYHFELLQNKVIFIQLKLLNSSYPSSCIIQIDYIQQQKNSRNNSGKYYFLTKKPIFKSSALAYSQLASIFFILFSSIFMFISLVLYILGLKENDIVIYFQNIYFIAMYLEDPNMTIVPFLNYLRISIFNFGINPWFNLIKRWDIYIQESQGNFSYFSNGSSIFRNVGFLLYLAIQNACFILLFLILYYVAGNSQNQYCVKIRKYMMKFKKKTFRFLEYVHKFTMYPLIFFSIILLTFNGRSLVQEQFNTSNVYLASIIIIVYTIVAAVQFKFSQIAQFNRYEGLMEYIFDILNSVIIIKSMYSLGIFGLMPVILIRGCLRTLNYYVWMHKFSFEYIYLIFIAFVECLVIIPIYLLSIPGTACMIVLYLISIVTFKIRIKIKNDSRNFLSRKINNIPGSSRQDLNAIKTQKSSEPAEDINAIQSMNNIQKKVNSSESILAKSKETIIIV